MTERLCCRPSCPGRHRAPGIRRMEFPVLDVVFVAGILALIALVALVAKGVERL
ncbi:hypothetical protein M2152_002334 [Microbacteriaceae bacterium SG_E_30_P1]|uniref:Uncharacterized protein n=1 Tax=Antiquaquibacter oligotrophicus TaxID=2880260 RepID=A0ABT6KQ93_9MICO|nr:hypothetical protein [Antiquaquibacter oligotrophicus]MDH6182152.1 hypothetical protein [Antiquaquibacter oligotrophicus]UDF12185.1 hypothetical protein LH407_08400 [Antiquaquibacter oligotrophicus]